MHLYWIILLDYIGLHPNSVTRLYSIKPAKWLANARLCSYVKQKYYIYYYAISQSH